MQQAAIHPIIYVRGYAMTQNEIEDTVADPYMGFNIGSSKVRQLWDGSVKKFFFESPLVRLMKEFGYDDVYEEGMDQVIDQRAQRKSVPYRSVIIYRYYEPLSQDLGTKEKPNIEKFARGLSELILSLRKRIYPQGKDTPITDGMLPYDSFRVYLVAHSMGGLVCRAFLQNPKYGDDTARKLVDKVFTYATPHNGIEFRGLGNVPEWLSIFGIDTFSRATMAGYLGLKKQDLDGNDVDIVTRFDPDRIFNLVGTNPGDYKVAAGFSSLGVGEASDGLVRISNATTRGRKQGVLKSSPNAFVHRSHSGYFGIVNSEEGYQNLVRFLFGDVRADGYLDIDELTLPPEVEKEYESGKEVRASYLFEVTVSIRNKQWQLHRRTANENSAIFRPFDALFPKWNSRKKGWIPDRTKSPLLFNVFLDMDQSQTGDTLAFSADLCVRAPEYEVDGFLFLKNHFEGNYLFRDLIILEAAFPKSETDTWKIEYQFASRRGEPPQQAITTETDDELVFEIPIEQRQAPGMKAKLRVITTFWNR
ncbi:MAG: hypothetical protein ACREQW_00555 [Candidatus Binatia bacterium]